MTYNELMLQSLTNLLKDGETLKYPIYGTLIQNSNHWFGFFGLTDTNLLIVLLEGSSQIVSWTSRVPLDIKNVKVKKSWFPFQYKVHIEFNEGGPCNFRVSKRVYGIKSQETNFDKFIELIQSK